MLKDESILYQWLILVVLLITCLFQIYYLAEIRTGVINLYKDDAPKLFLHQGERNA